VQPTNCGSCLRGRLQELEALYNAYWCYTKITFPTKRIGS
jgi:hypothetical protein